MRKRSIAVIAWCVLFALLSLWLSVINIDMTPARLFATYWPLYLFGAIGVVVLLVANRRR